MSYLETTFVPSPVPPASGAPYLRRRAAAQYLISTYGVPAAPATLAKLASIGGGPAITYFNKVPLYAVKDLDAWANTKLQAPIRSTSEKPWPGDLPIDDRPKP